MISANQIRQVILAYLLDSDVDRFSIDFAKLSHNVHANGDPEAIVLANEVELKMAALHDNLISQENFRKFLRDSVVANAIVSTVSAQQIQLWSNPYLPERVASAASAPSPAASMQPA